MWHNVYNKNLVSSMPDRPCSKSCASASVSPDRAYATRRSQDWQYERSEC